MSISSHYQTQIECGNLTPDSAQQAAISALDALSHSLAIGHSNKGIYFYGPVGRGKTMLMDWFYGFTQVENKTRLHFHHFMQQVHKELNQIQGIRDPLNHIAQNWAKQTSLLCFDEFFVTDIGDAIIMARLFEALFEAGVTLVATSNCHPTELYKDGLHRDRFEPTIHLLMRHCEVISVCGETDHRFSKGTTAHHYFVKDKSAFWEAFTKADGEFKPTVLTLNNRQVNMLGGGDNLACFDFMEICSSPRATNDYIELAKQFNCIFISELPLLGVTPEHKDVAQGTEEGYIRPSDATQTRIGDDEARRLIALIDECYEAKVLVVFLADAPIEQIYQGEQLAFAFARCISRVTEMQSWPLKA
ncbi:cell division protein ZapE [Pseudoalteromonas piscicida]|uniref:Cell division protein ZapE n=1 Tax=Pseudoalteromonas piscicida TaxID=43662 RepID=A0A2A5JTB6_PSEO7|nr:cell division protein ZapE [Pseudoalteromonas piscicida]PCK32703.1 cell division protein ZapE [Pseudoalteromonas piscicida]